MFDQTKYRAFLFDCDGVILDSNEIKTQAFYELAIPYGISAADRLVAYHKQNGGISRFRKIEYFYRNILCYEQCESQISIAVKRYGELVFGKLMSCPLTNACEDFLHTLPSGVPKIVISGGPEVELREVFNRKGLDRYFDGIFGSPRSKEEILCHLVEQGRLLKPAVLFGDTCYDYKIASLFGVDFVFMSRYSEVAGPQEFSGALNVEVVLDFSCLNSV